MVNKFRLNTLKNNETKEAISRTLAIANDYGGELNIEVISLSKIELDPNNNRILALTLEDAINGIDPDDPEIIKKRQDIKQLESLAKTIKEDQLINPIFVYRFGNKCRLIAGERRTLASALARKKEIIARIASERPVGTKLKVLQWIENNERADLSLAERLATLKAILDEYINEKNISYTELKSPAKTLSELTGISGTQSRRYVMILEASNDIKDAVNKGLIENIKIVELILTIDDPNNQSQLLKAALAGMPFNSLIKLKNEIESSTLKYRTQLRVKSLDHISLGKVQPALAKIIFKSLIESKILKESLLDKVNHIQQNVKWENIKSVESSIKKAFLLISQDL